MFWYVLLPKDIARMDVYLNCTKKRRKKHGLNLTELTSSHFLTIVNVLKKSFSTFVLIIHTDAVYQIISSN